MTLIPCLTGTDTEVTIVGADGSRHALVTACAPYALAPRSTLRGMAPWAVDSAVQGPGIAGEAITNIRAEARDIVVPVIVNSLTEIGLDTAIAGLVPVLSPDRDTPCRIVYTRADGTSREITATYIGGADQIEILDLGVHRHTVAPLRFRAHSPFWRQINATFGESVGNFSNGLLGNSNEFTITNTSDVRTWPEWTLTGPLDNAHLANITTGQIFRVIEVLAAGQTARITTDPANRGVWLGDDLRHDILDPSAAELWPLLAGTNHLIFRALYAVTEPVPGAWTMRWPILFETC